MKSDKFDKARGMLSQALNVAVNSLGNDRNIIEARNNIRKAIRNLDESSKRKKHGENMQSEHDKWWSNVTTGAQFTTMSPESAQASMKGLDGLIDAEKAKLDELEKASDNPGEIPDDLLNG